MIDKLCIKLNKAAEWVVVIVATIVTTYLAFCAWTNTFNAGDSFAIKTNMFAHLGIALLVIALMWCLGLLNKYPKTCKWLVVVLFIVTSLFVGIICWTYVIQTLIWPGSDSSACMTLATWFYESNFSAVVPKDSYLSLWPFQTGLIFILEKTMRLFHETGPLLFQKINCLYVLFMFVSGFAIVCNITKRVEGRVAYLLLASTYSPILFAITEVYGDLPGYAWMMFCCLCFIKWSQKKRFSLMWMILCCGSMILACIYKRNCLIYAIAVLLVFLVMQLRKRQIIESVIVFLAFILAVTGTGLTTKYYERYAQNTCGKGVPAIAFIAMGLQSDNYGGWNGFHSNTYMATGYDYEETVRLSKESIAESMATFTESPTFGIHFFHTKTLRQWANPTHATFWDINTLYDTKRDAQSFWVEYLHMQKYHLLIPFMDVHQSIVYGILVISGYVLLYQLIKKRNVEMEHLIPYVALIGGFLFSLLWEAQSGAVMYYLILLLPVAIGVISTQTEKIVLSRR